MTDNPKIFKASPELHALIKATARAGKPLESGLFAGLRIITSEAIPRGCIALTGDHETVIGVVDEELKR